MKRKRRIMRLKKTKRRYVTRRRRQKTEVKYYNLIQSRQGVNMTIPNGGWTLGSPSQASSANSFAINNILANIGIGADEGQRIGRSIFVKSIIVKHYVNMCPQDSTYNLSSAALRVTWCSINGNPQTAISTWFKDPIRDRMLGSFNNSYYKLHYNKIYNLSSGAVATSSGSTNTIGAHKFIKYKLNLNRKVDYSSATDIKNEQDIYSLFFNAAYPNGADGKQVFCINTQIQIFYTDG